MSERGRRQQQPTPSDLSFDQALANFIQTDPRELADEIEQIKRQDREVSDYVEQRRGSIRQGARRAKERFRI
jgi:hypothetical protein